MPDRARLEALLRRIDSRSYRAYKDLKGSWSLEGFELIIDHVQGDPFAAPSRIRARRSVALPDGIWDDAVAKLATEDWLLRKLVSHLGGRGGKTRARGGERRGSGRSGELGVLRPGPEIVERSALRLVGPQTIEARLTVGLPAAGRRVLGQQALALLEQDVGRAMESLMVDAGLDSHIASMRAQQQLRAQLAEQGLVAFVANGSVLPRRSGVHTEPLPDAVPFQSPKTYSVTLDTHAGPISGMGIPAGVTLIVGGGFHGKSTLLQAIQTGHLDHIPGDGREAVVALPEVVKVRAEDGRRVQSVDISGFLGNLPGGQSTTCFSTADASGSTSQAAAISEALEAGARLLLVDEDTSATNLMVRDERMAALIPADREPITPFVQRVRELHIQQGVSTVLVVGGVGDYFAVADHVIGMNAWRAEDLTAQAHALAGAVEPAGQPLPTLEPRCVLGIEADARVRARDRRAIGYGKQDIDLHAVEDVRDAVHSASLGYALRWLAPRADGRAALAELLDALDRALDERGVELLSVWNTPPGDIVRPRRFEVAAALNRLRTLECST